MKTYPILRPDGSLLAFEISSAWLTFGPLYRVLRSVEGVSDVKRNWFKDDRIIFNFRSEPFVVNEPWGDSSRYWVGPFDTEKTMVDITPLHNAFQQHRGAIAKVGSWVIGAHG